MSVDTAVLKGRKVVGGVVEGEALVTRQTISGWGGINPTLGTITETRHELRGVSFKDKILVFPGAKGSSGWSAMFHMTRLSGTAPKALLFTEMTTKVALGAVVMRVPSSERAMPKSVRLVTSCWSSRIFSGLISRCTIPRS